VPEPELTWDAFYATTAGREPRPLLLQALDGPDGLGAGAGRLAVDLGCGDGTDALLLLARGWTVLAVDSHPSGLAALRSRLPAGAADRLTVRQQSFTEVVLPPAALIHAGFSLPFCDPADFPGVWERIRAALTPVGMFAGQLFGDHDTWAGDPGLTTFSRTEVDALLATWQVVSFVELDEDGDSAMGPKHWHIYNVIAAP
jgi:SAM-dependent methyltransferase